MANDSIDQFKVLSETDLFSTMSKSDSSAVHEDNYSWRYRAKTYFNNSKQLRNSVSNLSIKDHLYVNIDKDLLDSRPITINHMLKTQNTNAPWLLNVLTKKFHRSRKHKTNRIETNNSAEELLERPISSDGSSGRWIITERDVLCSLIKNFDRSTSGQYNISRAASSSIPLSTDHYHYEFQPSSSSSVLIDHSPQISTEEIDPNQSNVEAASDDFISITSMIKNYYTSKRQLTESNTSEQMEMTSSSPPGTVVEDLPMTSGNSTSKRAKSASASARQYRRTASANTTKRGKRRSESTKKKKSKYYQEHLLTPAERELRESLRIIDLDNIGFFSPNQLRKVFKEIGIHSHEIDKIEQCLPLDDDGHYSIDNLVKLFLGSKN